MYQKNFEKKTTDSYVLDDFQNIYDEDFVVAAYRAILRRDPDPIGMKYYLSRVRRGVSKVQILNQLMKSDESKAINTKVFGLDEAILFDHVSDIPIFGRIFFALLFLINIKSHLSDLRALENHVARLLEHSRAKNKE